MENIEYTMIVKGTDGSETPIADFLLKNPKHEYFSRSDASDACYQAFRRCKKVIAKLQEAAFTLDPDDPNDHEDEIAALAEAMEHLRTVERALRAPGGAEEDLGVRTAWTDEVSAFYPALKEVLPGALVLLDEMNKAVNALGVSLENRGFVIETRILGGIRDLTARVTQDLLDAAEAAQADNPKSVN